MSTEFVISDPTLSAAQTREAMLDFELERVGRARTFATPGPGIRIVRLVKDVIHQGRLYEAGEKLALSNEFADTIPDRWSLLVQG